VAGGRLGLNAMRDPETEAGPAAGTNAMAVAQGARLGAGRRRVGVALGSGSARGLAHIGVLRALRDAGVQVDVVAGTSMGAFVGAIFAAGQLERLERDFLGFDWASIASLLDPVFPRSGLLDGVKIGDFMRTHVQQANIEELPIPFRAMATDIATGEEVVIGSGDLIAAVRASIAVPGVFTPVRSNGRVLVDGGLVNPVPVSAARALGADFVIAVDLNHDIVTGRQRLPLASDHGGNGAIAHALTQVLDGFESFQPPGLASLREWLKRERLPGIVDVLLASMYIMQARITQATLLQDQPEVLIQPPLGAVRFMDFRRTAEIVEIGYRSTVQVLERLGLDARSG